MINDKPNHLRVLDLLSSYEPIFSAQFRDEIGLLDYRTRISELRKMGYRIVSIKISDGKFKRPAYQLLRPLNEQELFNRS